jgi:hypothetical protein
MPKGLIVKYIQMRNQGKIIVPEIKLKAQRVMSGIRKV